jgi:hypothetical protein
MDRIIRSAVTVYCPLYRKQESVPYQKLGSLIDVNICDDGCGAAECLQCVAKVKSDLIEHPRSDGPQLPE